MRKHIITIIASLIVLCSIILILNPYHFDSRAIDYASDLAFKDHVNVNSAEVVLDYSDNEILNGTLYGRITVRYDVTSDTETKAILPLASNINNTNYSSSINKNVEIKINGADASASMYYGKAMSTSESLNNYSYNTLHSLEYKKNCDENEYYVYEYTNKDIILAINYSSINDASMFYFGMERLSARDIFILKMKNEFPSSMDSKNRALFRVKSSGPAYIISSVRLSSIGLSEVGKEMTLVGNEDLYKFIINNLAAEKNNIDINDTVIAIENEINEMLRSSGLHYFNVDDLINDDRISMYEFSIPAGNSTIEFSYNAFAGVDMRYNVPYYEASFKLNKKNFASCSSFKATYKLSEENKYLNFSTVEWDKIEGGYSYNKDEAPKEIKIFFSSAEAPVKSFQTLTILVSGFIKYLIFPALVCLLFIILFIRAYTYYKDKKVKLFEEIKRLLKLGISYIPETLTFYLVGFKFYTLYTGFSGISEINVLLVLIFLLLCATYIIFKTIKKISWIKLIIFAILAIVPTILALDPAFVLLIALALCYLEKGTKPFLKAMYISIAFFSILTVALNALEIITDESFFMWVSLSQGVGEAGQVRFSLGFSHPNTAGLFVFTGVLCYILYQEKTSNVSRLFMLIICGVVFFLTRSRTSAFCTLILIVLDIISDYVKLKGRWRYIFVLLFPLFVVISWYVITTYGGEYDTQFDALFSHRPYYIFEKYLKDFNYLSLKGLEAVEGYPVDNLYMNVLVLEGTPVFIIYAIIYILISYYVIKSKNTKYLFALGAYLLFSMFEATLMCYACATFVGLIFISILGKNKFNIDGTLVERGGESNGNNLR